MAAKPIKRVSRGKKLTKAQAAKYGRIRRQVEAEKPEINARIKARLRTRDTIARACRQLKALREAQGKSLADMRELTGMDRSAISKLERGERNNTSVDTLIRYAQALGKTVLLSIVDGE
jgi:predicted transcriptional regulator